MKAKKKAKKAKKTKRTVKKKAKKASKKPIKVTVTKKILGKAPETKTFYLKDGRKLKTVYELVDELETMTDNLFQEYLANGENHFANWIEHVFNEKSLAEEMRHIEDRLDTQRAILKHLVRELSKVKA